MQTIDVKIVHLDPMRVAVFHGYGPNPEELAWKQMEEWAADRGCFQPTGTARIFGFNNPNPSDATPNYGYELWLTLSDEIEVDSPARVRQFPGGMYAVTHLENIVDPGDQIPRAWHALYLWVEDSRYKMTDEPCLEEDHRRPGMPPDSKWEMDLYLPVREQRRSRSSGRPEVII